jgi:hypothetical protein
VQYDWVRNRLAAAAENKWVETANFSTTTATTVTDFADSSHVVLNRYRNQVQISVKAISVSEMSAATNSIGGAGTLEYNLMYAQQELRRDMEFHMVGNYASVVGDSSTTAPVTASYIAGCQDQTNPTRNLYDGASTQGGWNTSTKVFDAATLGTKRAITETLLRNMAQALYLGGVGGADQTLVAMCAPTIKRTISQYMYTSSARIAQLVKDVGGTSQATAQGSVEIFITDFGTLQLEANRFMGDLGTDQYAILIFDPMFYEQVFLRGINTTAGAKLGLVERRIVNAYWGTRFFPEAMGVIMDIDDAAAMTA